MTGKATLERDPVLEEKKKVSTHGCYCFLCARGVLALALAFCFFIFSAGKAGARTVYWGFAYYEGEIPHQSDTLTWFWLLLRFGLQFRSAFSFLLVARRTKFLMSVLTNV